MPRIHAYRSALVTGASSGIGERFARHLAAAGCDLVVVARRRERLEALAAELRRRHGVEVEVVAADLTEPDELRPVEDRLADPDRRIELLVNNAGFGTSGEFAALPVDGEDQEVRLNVLALSRLAHAALTSMVVHGHGGVLNVSSLAGLLPAPGVATYNATKSFVTTFSESLDMEAKPYGVHVTALLPGFTRTEFQDRSGLEPSELPGTAWLDADAVARDGLRAVAAGDPVCIPGAQYKAVSAALRLLPRGALRRIVPRVWSRA